jgi:hypothetical protein
MSLGKKNVLPRHLDGSITVTFCQCLNIPEMWSGMAKLETVPQVEVADCILECVAFCGLVVLNRCTFQFPFLLSQESFEFRRTDWKRQL